MVQRRNSNARQGVRYNNARDIYVHRKSLYEAPRRSSIERRRVEPRRTVVSNVGLALKEAITHANASEKRAIYGIIQQYALLFKESEETTEIFAIQEPGAAAPERLLFAPERQPIAAPPPVYQPNPAPAPVYRPLSIVVLPNVVLGAVLTNPLPNIFKWQGNKAGEVNNILPHLPRDIRNFTLTESFVGAATIALRLNQDGTVLNDINENLIGVYKMMKAGRGAEIANWIQNVDADEDIFNFYKDECQSIDPFQQSKKLLYLLYHSWNGLMESYYVRRNRVSGTVSGVPQLSRRLRNPRYTRFFEGTTLLSGDFTNIFWQFNRPDCFHFIDMPYFDTQGYSVQFTYHQHCLLAALFRKSQSYCLIIVQDSSFMRDLYAGYIVDWYEISRTVNGVPTTVTHLVIRNYNLH